MNVRPFYHSWFFVVTVTLGLAFQGMTGLGGVPALGAENLITDGTFTGAYKISSQNDIYIIWGGAGSDPSGYLDTAGTTWAYATTDPSGTPGTFGYYVRSNQTSGWTGSVPSVGNAVGLQVFNEAGNAAISQTVSGLEPGKLYIASYEYNARKGNTVTVVSSITGASEIPLQNTTFGNSGTLPFQKYSSTFTADSSTAVLSIAHSSTGGDKTLFVGNVSLTLSPAQPLKNLVQDGSFESGSYTYASGHGQYIIWATTAPTSGNFENSGIWKYESSSAAGYYLRPSASEFHAGPIPDGTYVAALQSYANPVTASLYQEIGTTPGKTYAVSCKYNARKNDTAELSIAAEGATATKTFLDRQLVTANTTSNYTFAGTFTASDAVTKLRFTNTINGGGDADRTVTIDKVQMVEVPSKIVEAGGTLIHALDAAGTGKAGYGNNGVTKIPYTYDASDAYSNAIYDRVGYYVELVDKAGNYSYALISMDPFSSNLNDVGLPTGAPILTSVRNLSVESNVASISRSGISGGRIEFGRGDYSAGANGMYDYWDTGFQNAVGYGSFQILDADTKTTLFSYCGWGKADNAGIGLGNSGGSSRDWTFSANINNGNYAVANIYSYIHESDAVLNPTSPSFFQRGADGNASATISGSWQAIADDTIATIRISENGTDWTDATLDAANKTFTSAVTLGTGWHAFQIQAFDAAGNLVTSASTGKIGVGDVLVAAGKTDTRSGSVWATSGNVVTLDPVTGKISLTGGSTPWAETGEALTQKFPDVPVAFVDATTNDQTQALAVLQAALDGLDGEMAVLWLQDGAAVTSEQLKEKIEANQDLSWVLGASSSETVPQMAELASSLENASAGPMTSQYGTLAALGQAWGYSVLTGPYQVPEPSTLVLLVFGLAIFGWKRACF